MGKTLGARKLTPADMVRTKAPAVGGGAQNAKGGLASTSSVIILKISVFSHQSW